MKLKSENSEEIISFFDRLSSSWDEMEESSQDELRQFLKFLPIGEDDRILDIACGTGVISSLLQERTSLPVDAIDISEGMIEKAQEKYKDSPIHFKCMDFLSLEGKTYDFCIIFNAYPHFLSPDQVARKAKEVVAENGYFVILHNLSRKELDACHEGKVSLISRNLKTPEEEAIPYLSDFDLVKKEDNDHMYLLMLRKK